MYLMLSD